MAAFLDGNLSPGEVAEVAEHLRECADCSTVIGEAARFEQEEIEAQHAAAPPAGKRTSRRAGWAIAAAAVLGGVVAGIRLLQPAAPLEALIDAAPRDYRRVDGRLSGFACAPLRGTQRSKSEARAELKLRSEALDVLSRTIDDDSVEARRAAGVAHLLIDQTRESLDKLATAAGDSKDAHVWNDLAAAQLTVAVRGDADAFPSALASADRAIAIDPLLPEAHFNRALILQRMGDKEEARAEWMRYLKLDPSSEWANEARQHLRDLGDSTRLDFKTELARAARNRDAVPDLVRRFPQDSRFEGQGRLLLAWAAATVANDAARAEENLSLARAIGAQLAARRGERFLADVTAAIDRTPDPRAFASAYLAYNEAVLAYRKLNPDAAEPGFRRAAAAFRAMNNPLADAATFAAADCAYLRNRAAESTAEMRALRARLHPSYLALGAHIDWILARNANTAADWGTAATLGARASATFAALGERQNGAYTAAIEAFALDSMGALDLAWQKRVRAINDTIDPSRIANIFHSAALTFAASEQNASASTMLDLAIANQNRVETPSVRLAVFLTQRARMAERAGDLLGARRRLDQARAALAPIRDASMREEPQAQIDIAEAVLRRTNDPQGAVAALDESIAFLENAGYAVFLPDAYLQRARAHRAMHRDDAALADYNAALRRIDQQQESSNADVRIEFLDIAAQALGELIDLHLDRGEIAAAFAVTDRAHAMATDDDRIAPIPAETAVIEYAMLPDSLVIFCVTRNGISAARVNLGRTALGQRVLAFVRNVQAQKDVAQESRALYATLLAPIAPRIASARELVIVPDRQLNMLPFAALHDGTSYLIEKHAIRIALSARAERQKPARAASVAATIIADPAIEDAPRLQWSRDEARTIAAVIGNATIVQGADATRTRMLEALQSSAIVHYAGHADSDVQSYGALLLAPEGGDSGLLTAAEISRLELPARPLVVLSACGTLRGSTTHVAGMPSLARAFLGAGARAVAGTLWEVDDDVASELFLTFHEHLRAGEVPADALRAAQIAMLQTSSDPRRRHPSSWSAVEVLSNL